MPPLHSSDSSVPPLLKVHYFRNVHRPVTCLHIYVPIFISLPHPRDATHWLARLVLMAAPAVWGL